MTLRFCCFLFLLLSLCSCNSINRLAKARAAKPSPFLAHGDQLQKTKAGHSPFLRVWKNPSEEVKEKAWEKKQIYIAPVSTEHLRPMTKPLSRIEIREKSRQKAAVKLGEYARSEFIKAFEESESPRFEIVAEPDDETLHLEMAIVELNPTAISAGILRRAIGFLVVPGAEVLVSTYLKGNIAIEGRIRDPEQKESLYEFADAEQNRSALILSVHDFNAYSAARQIIREWAEQFEEVVRTPEGERVRDSLAFTFWFW